MNTDKTFAEENDQVITNELVKDAEGNVIAEDITCETSTRLPVLKFDDLDYGIVVDFP